MPFRHLSGRGTREREGLDLGFSSAGRPPEPGVSTRDGTDKIGRITGLSAYILQS